MEAETASLRAFVFEAACLLGCEADEPGALESMIVELYAMRDRDVDGAKEIESLRAEVERITAELDALRASGVDWARCIVGLQPEIDSLRAEVERLGAELAAVRVPKSERDEAAPPPGWIVTPRGNVIKNVAGKCDLRHAWAVYDREHGYAPVDAIVDLRAEVERLTVELAATRAPKPERADVFTAGMAAVAAWQQYDREQARRATIAEYDEPCALAEKEPTP